MKKAKTTGRNRPRVIIEADDDDDDDEQPAAPQPAPEDDALETLLAELGPSASDARIVVWRVVPNGDPEECMECPLALFSKDQLRADFGPGRYKVEVKRRGQFVRRWWWQFAAPLRAATTTTTNSDAAERSRVLELERQLAAERERERTRTHELMLALLGRQQPSGPSLGDLIAQASQLRELVGGGATGGGIKDVLGTLKDVLALRNELGESDRGSTMTDVVLEGLKMLPQIASAAQAQPAASAATPARPRVAAPVSARDRVVAMVLQHAKAGTAPAVAAQLAWAQMQTLSEDAFDAACSALESEGAADLIVTLEPRLAPARAWLLQVAGELRPLISAASEPESLTDGQDGADAAHQDLTDDTGQ